MRCIGTVPVERYSDGYKSVEIKLGQKVGGPGVDTQRRNVRCMGDTTPVK